MGLFSRRKPEPDVSTEGLLLDRAWDDADLDTAYDAVKRGDLESGLELLRASRGDLNQRAIRVVGLGKAALGQSERLEALAHRQDAGGAALTWLAQVLVFEAWEVRTAAPAHEVSKERFAMFHDILRTANDVAGAAIESDPDDPTPFVTLQWIALGLGAPREDHDAVFLSALARCPDLYLAYSARVQALAPKWFGSLDELAGFGEETADSAPTGDPRAAILAEAMAELELAVVHHKEESKVQRIKLYTKQFRGRRDMLRAARERWLQPGRANHPADLLAHGTFAYVFRALDQPVAALEHAEAMNGRVPFVPWAYLGDPLQAFATAMSKQMVR